MAEEHTPEERFAVQINLAMANAIQAGADTTTLAKLCLSTARELWDHYDAGDEELAYVEFVTSVGFEAAEIEEWIDDVEGKPWRDDDGAE